jgi:hypothetical protein
LGESGVIWKEGDATFIELKDSIDVAILGQC